MGRAISGNPCPGIKSSDPFLSLVQPGSLICKLVRKEWRPGRQLSIHFREPLPSHNFRGVVMRFRDLLTGNGATDVHATENRKGKEECESD